MKFLFLALFVIFGFTACKNQNTPTPATATNLHVEKKDPYTQPSWVNSPQKDGKVGAVGTAYPHFKGKSYQRKLAISRGLDELAQQSGVNINSKISTLQQRDGQDTRSKAQIYTVQNSANETINAHIEAIWTDPRTKEIYIWLLQD